MMEVSKRYHGVVVPLVTPLTHKFKLDDEAVEELLDLMNDCSHMPFILGTTGEASSLPLSVKHDYIKKVTLLKKKYQVLYAGIGSNCLEDSVELANYCFDAGIDVVVATLPSYYNLTEDQVMRYFEDLANAIPGHLMIYNIPSTTHMSIPLTLIDRLSHHEKIAGIKDSERSEERMKQSLQLWAKRADFSYLIGWAAKSVEALLNGADGIVPSSANLDPTLYQFLDGCLLNGDIETAKKIQRQSDDIGNVYQSGKTLGESLAALKVLMNHLKICQPFVMPPLQRLSAEEEKKLIAAYEVLRHEQ